jgi:hypothetical protein
MPQIVDARAAAVFVEDLPLAKAYSLADHGEVVAGGAVGRAVAILEEEEGVASASTEDTVPFCPICPEPFSCTRRYRNEAAPAILRAPNHQHRFLEIDILLVEPKCFVHT